MKKFLKSLLISVLSYLVIGWFLILLKITRADALTYSIITAAIVFFILIIRKTKNKEEDKTAESIQYLVKDFEIIVTGIFYNSNKTGINRQVYIEEIELYEKVTLIADSKNEFDSNAIIVINSNNIDIGFVKHSETSYLKPYLNPNYIIDACVIKKYKVKGGVSIIIDVIIREYR